MAQYVDATLSPYKCHRIRDVHNLSLKGSRKKRMKRAMDAKGIEAFPTIPGFDELNEEFTSRTKDEEERKGFIGALRRMLRTCQEWLWLDDNDEEDDPLDESFFSNPFPTLPPSLPALVHTTNFDPKWITFLYRNFKQRSPNGRMSNGEWRDLMRCLFPRTTQDDFADRMFEYMRNDKNYITFENLVMFLHSLSTDESSLSKFVFSVLEPDNQGRVSSSSFISYVRAVFALCGQKTSSGHYMSDGSITAFAVQRFQELDGDHDGFVTADDICSLLQDMDVHSLFPSIAPTTPLRPPLLPF